MKELTIEEKAKAYDRAFERAKKLHETCDSQAVVGWCEYIFPELHESEDEKVREDIISLVNEFWERIGSINPEYSSRNRMLAWLEKQNKVVNEICKENDDSLTNEDEKIRKALIEYFNEQCDMSDWNGVYGYQVVAWLEKQGVQEFAWDEKDESHLIHCVRLINNAEGCSISEQENAIDWLKSIKKRIGE